MTHGAGDLVAGEGVDEGSAQGEPTQPPADVVGPGPHGAPEREESPAPPDVLETEQSRRRQDGQQLAAGEG